MGLPPGAVPENGGRVRAPAPTTELAPVPLARQTQAQKLNRISGKFPPTQGPSGPGWKRWQALLALRAGNFAQPPRRASPVVGDRGKGEYERGALILSRPRGRFGYFAATGKVTRRPGPGSLEKKPIFGGEIGAIPKGGGRGTPQGGFSRPFVRFTFSPSPTVLKKTFLVCVGEALGPPAGNVPHLKRSPSSVWPNGQPPSP